MAVCGVVAAAVVGNLNADVANVCLVNRNNATIAVVSDCNGNCVPHLNPGMCTDAIVLGGDICIVGYGASLMSNLGIMM